MAFVSERGQRVLLAAEALILLLPLTLLTALMVAMMYPAYPIPNVRPMTVVFDAAMLIQLSGIVAAWRLVVPSLALSRTRLRDPHRLWVALVIVAAAIGLAGVAIAVEHALNPGIARDLVGFALLAPAAALAPIALHLYRERAAAGHHAFGVSRHSRSRER